MEKVIEPTRKPRKPLCTCGTCSSCKQRQYGATYRKAHPERAREHCRNYLRANLEREQVRQKQYREEFKEEINARSRKRREERPALQKKYLYGLAEETYMHMLKEQHGLCARCGQPETAVHKNGRVLTLSVDHCHESGRIRSLLCQRCNRRLGFFEADLDRLKKDICYLVQHASPAVAILHEVLNQKALT